jgi:signal transduction histidine kinase
MRPGLKGAAALLAGYAVLMAAFGAGMEWSLRDFERRVTEHALALLAREQAALVSERSLETLRFPGAAAQRRLRERIEDLTVLSEMVSSISVVDREGRVLVSDDPRAGERFPPAAAVFADPPEARVEASPFPSFLEGGDYVAFLPLTEGGRLAGYLRFALHSERIAGMYRESRRRVVGAALLGLIGVGALGAFLQLQLSRQAASITAAIEGSPRAEGPRARPAEELGRALDAAGRVRRALDEAQRQASRRGQQVDALAEILRVGVVLLRRDLDVDFASEKSLELLGVEDTASFKRRWEGVKSRIKDQLDAGAARPVTTLSLPEEGGRRLRVELHRREGEGADSLVALLSDAGMLDTLQQDVRLARQLEGMGRLYRTVAHELRAPLSAMMINLDLLRESLAAEGEATARREHQERYVGVLRDELDRLNRSLNAILTQTVPEAPPQEFDLRSVIGDIGSLLAPQARRQNVRLDLLLPPGEEVRLRGHPDRLKQAFLNVAVNALEAMAGGGRLTIEAGSEGTRAWVAIRDSGPGIPPDLLARIYDLDFSTKQGGSGIGLHVARALVELHGGEIRTESEPGAGTTVHVTLPVAPRG